MPISSKEKGHGGSCHPRTGAPPQFASFDDTSHGGGSGDAYVFRGFNGRLMKKSPERTSLGDAYITYALFSTFLALWLGGGDGNLQRSSYPSIYGSQSSRNGTSLAASNAGISRELWGQHVD